MDGFDVEVAREIAGRLGAEARFATPQWEVVGDMREEGVLSRLSRSGMATTIPPPPTEP